ncbi:MAG TPA: ribosome small subunit-dependent GTPase, partial [bacterium]|nr:ribosome small subunit-dependent GTPase [bacterium]
MTLDHLGWQPFFDTAFKPYAGEFQVGRIAVQQTRVYELWTEAGVISAEMSGNLRKSAEIDSTLRPVVGDWVVIQLRLAERFAVIHHVLPRRTKFSRKVTEEVTREQVIAANIDIAFLVSGLDQDFNLRRLE